LPTIPAVVSSRPAISVSCSPSAVEHDPGPLNLLPRTLLSPRDPDQLGTLLITEFDPVTGRARHHHQVQRAPPGSFTDSDAN